MQSMISKKLSSLLLSVLGLFAIGTHAQNISIATGGTGGILPNGWRLSGCT